MRLNGVNIHILLRRCGWCSASTWFRLGVERKEIPILHKKNSENNRFHNDKEPNQRLVNLSIISARTNKCEGQALIKKGYRIEIIEANKDVLTK